ncbi:MAG TPA: thiol-activated cytolysin family protein [Kofleriaceae bacterium]|nr:thiol-activated cytolysin family protein [Kofleriaceae bacterium]
MNRVALSVLCFSIACTSDPPNVEDSDNPIDQVFADLGKLPVEQARRIEGMPSDAMPDGDYRCVETPIDEVRQYDQLLGQLSVGDVVWPGSMLRGDSVYSGRLTPLVLPRAPLTFSVSLESLGAGRRSATMDAPSLSAYRDAIGQILAQEITGSTPARISAEVEEISSEQQLGVALGAQVDAPLVATVKAGFNFADTQKRSRFVVKFFQLYYTVDVDPPSLPHDFFAPTVTADEVAAIATADSPPVYVSSIGYGRQVIFTFESDLSKSELQAALSFVYQGGAEISGSVSLTHQEVLSHTHTTAFILGGDAGEAAAVSIGNYDQLKEFIGKGGNYSKDSPGAAIAYKLSYVRDHTPVQISYASQYRQRECERVSQKLHVVFEKLTVDNAGGDLGGDLEIYGTVSAQGSDFSQPLATWPVNQFIQIGGGKSFPPSGIVGEAIVGVSPQAGNALYIDTDLHEDDGLGDDSFGGLVTDAAPYEAGWRRTLQVHRNAGTQQITLQISLTPVP